MAKPPTDKRSSRRVKVKASVPVKVVESVEAQVRDVSMRGVYVYLQSRVSVGSALELVLPLPEGVMGEEPVWIRCTCRVVRVEEAPGGGEFGVAAMIEDYEALEQAPTAHA
jgi:hypothetical protein